MNISCPEHPGAIRPERQADGSLLYACGNHYAFVLVFARGASRKTSPADQARADELNRQASLT